MRRFLLTILGLVLGYAAGAAAGLLLVSSLSGNTHDRSLESVMTAAFVTGPIGAVLGCAVALLVVRRSDE